MTYPNVDRDRLEAEALEAKAAQKWRDIAAAQERRRADEREKEQAEAVLVSLAAEFTSTLDEVYAITRPWFPGGETLSAKILEAKLGYENTTTEARARAGIGRGNRYKADRILSQHPLRRLLPLLDMLASVPPATVMAARSDDPGEGGGERG